MDATIAALVPFAHVAEVEKSIRFYELLGFSARDRLSDGHGPYWAWLRAGDAELMLARASGPIPHDQQAILFYMYCDDPHALRAHVLAQGVSDGGAAGSSHSPPMPGVFEPTYPSWMPRGEVRLIDPDGYVIMVGWRDRLPERTPAR